MVSYEIPLGMSILVPALAAGTLSLAAIGRGPGRRAAQLADLPQPVRVRGVLRLLHRVAGELQAGPVRPAGERVGTGGRLPHRVQRHAVRVVLLRRVRGDVRRRRRWPCCCSWGRGTTRSGWCARLEQRGTAAGRPACLGAGIFIVKAFALVFVQMWLRWTLPRLRIDQVLYVCVKVLLPLACVDLVGAAAWAWLVPPSGSPQLAVQVAADRRRHGAACLLLRRACWLRAMFSAARGHRA